MGDLHYRLQRRFLSPSSFLSGPLLECCEKETLIQHFKSNGPLYNVTERSGLGDTCFAGKLKIAGFSGKSYVTFDNIYIDQILKNTWKSCQPLVYYFIAWRESTGSVFDIFVLSVTKGRCIDAFTTIKGSPYAEQISHMILVTSMTTVKSLVRTAAWEIRKRYLWSYFGAEYSLSLASSVTFMDDLYELRNISHHIDLIATDFQLQTLLCDELNELQIPWRDFFASIQRSPLFSHCITFNDGETGNPLSNYVIYCRDEDLFLDFILNQQSKFEVAHILVRDISAFDEKSNVMKSIPVRSAVTGFTTYLLKWIWWDCQTEF